MWYYAVLCMSYAYPMQAALAGVLSMNINVYSMRRMRTMRVQWATNEKAMMASNKHFNGQFNVAQMTTVATAMIKRADMVGTSDRANGNYAPAKIVWATFCLLYTSPSPRDS